MANHPGLIIKVGGVHRKINGQLEASNYGRANKRKQQADICGLCGMMPGGSYIWLPADPNENQTNQPVPGWQLISGTSSATSQVAGICALMVQARQKANLRPLSVESTREILRQSAIPVRVGQSFDGVRASSGWCLLANAERTVELAMQAP